ncbi:SDR family NAD(P)-dependent oxidoreductase [Sphingomonas sp. TX0543]|uniref:SDR family NAD(P)-dependent oxidoreductase n=1 Tax=Sphingomonas sp. TX0543 TaxID=3399682 RepID=UPI003AFB7940
MTARSRVVLITGAGSGIGRAVAECFAQDGASVALLDLDEVAIDVVATTLRDRGTEVFSNRCDVTDATQIDDAVEKIEREFGHIESAVNSAGVAQTLTSVGEISLEEWHRVISINLTGTWLTMRALLRVMLPRAAGSIVNIASVAGVRGTPDQAAYVASKHGVVGLTRSAAIDCAPKGVRINALCPGVIDTGMLERSFDQMGLDQAARDIARARVNAYHPMDRLGEPKEVAQAALFLCSTQATFLTGVCLPVDGGWTAR